MQLAQLYTRYVLAAHDTALWTLPNHQHSPTFSADVANANPELATASSRYKMAAVLVLLAQGPHGIEILLTRRAATLRQHAHQISFPGGRVDAGEAAAAAALRETWEEVGIAPAQVKLWGPLPWQQSQTGYLVQPWLGQLQSEPMQLHRAGKDHFAQNSAGFNGVDVNRLEIDRSRLHRVDVNQAINHARNAIWPALQLNPSEVSSAFGLPLQHLQAPEHWHQWQIPNEPSPHRLTAQAVAAQPSLPWQTGQQQPKPRTLYFLPYEQHLIWGLTAAILQSLRRLCLPQ